jgi:hypothetical protein
MSEQFIMVKMVPSDLSFQIFFVGPKLTILPKRFIVFGNAVVIPEFETELANFTGMELTYTFSPLRFLYRRVKPWTNSYMMG